jgi:glycosyltransferase involved in cell wall biosynthesis
MVGGKVKKVIFVGITPYPNGLAATNRMVSLLSELPVHSWNVSVICLASTKFPTSVLNEECFFERSGNYNGVQFRYISALVKVHENKFVRILSATWGFLTLPFFLSFHDNKEAEKSILLTNLTQGHYLIYLKLICLVLNYKLVLLRSEYPSIIRNRSRLKKAYQVLLESWIFKLCDGFALMTFTLRDYFGPLSRKDALMKVIPMSVNIERFSEKAVSPFTFDYIAYAGSLSSEKDGVDLLLRSFVRIAEKNPDLHLVIIGDTSNHPFFEKLISIAEQSKKEIKSRIHFTGQIESTKIPKYLNNAKILALARPDSVQAQGGFPTKLGEYLATGKPVVVTKTGEIPLYLTHKKTAILCTPGDIDNLTENLEWTVNNYQEAVVIGQSGKTLAEIVFSSKIQGKELSDFLKSF